tara:strand:- start:82 stop:438 length:357 start_codon:yes stop_codon:yes gene_type:complete
MIEVLLYILAAWGYLVLWFFAVGTYLRMERDHSLRNVPRFIYWSLYTMLVPGVILDFLFNITYGTLHYRKFPRDWLFSGTTARILRETEEEGAPYRSMRRRRALRWKAILNDIDPGHI